MGYHARDHRPGGEEVAGIGGLLLPGGWMSSERNGSHLRASQAPPFAHCRRAESVAGAGIFREFEILTPTGGAKSIPRRSYNFLPTATKFWPTGGMTTDSSRRMTGITTRS